MSKIAKIVGTHDDCFGEMMVKYLLQDGTTISVRGGDGEETERLCKELIRLYGQDGHIGWEIESL